MSEAISLEDIIDDLITFLPRIVDIEVGRTAAFRIYESLESKGSDQWGQHW